MEVVKDECNSGKKNYLSVPDPERCGNRRCESTGVYNGERTDEVPTETKDGPIRTPGALETEITTTAIFSSESDEMIAKLEKAVDDSEKVEIWEVNLDKPGTSDNVGKFAAKYFQGYVTEFGSTSSAEDHAEASLTFGIEGTGADGYATVSDEQQEIASYVFADTEKTGA